MDFHAYFEVYLGGRWHVFDARFNQPRIGRIKIAHGLDAVDGAFSTIYGAARWERFEVWSYQIDPAGDNASLDAPVDLSKRLCGDARSHHSRALSDAGRVVTALADCWRLTARCRDRPAPATTNPGPARWDPRRKWPAGVPGSAAT